MAVPSGLSASELATTQPKRAESGCVSDLKADGAFRRDDEREHHILSSSPTCHANRGISLPVLAGSPAARIQSSILNRPQASQRHLRCNPCLGGWSPTFRDRRDAGHSEQMGLQALLRLADGEFRSLVLG